MKKNYFLFLVLAVLISIGMNAQPVEVGYFTFDGKVMDPGALGVENDPIIQMLQDDANFNVTVVLAAETDTADLSAYDIVIVQESFGSSSAILNPDGGLGLGVIDKPFIYNKTFALRGGRGLVTGDAGLGSEVEGENYVYIKVDAANQANALFNGITFDGDSVALFHTVSTDNGTYIDPSRLKALNYARDVVLSDTTTMLGMPAVVNPTHNVTVSINDIPSGTQIGSVTLQARMIALGMNFGAICAHNGYNMTDAGFTLWRNAIYIAAGLTVPTTAYSKPKATVGYFTGSTRTLDAGAAAIDSDPIIMMLQEDGAFDVDVVIVDESGSVDSSGYDVVVVQEGLSSTASILQPGNSLHFASIPSPVVFNKSYTFKAGRALETGAAGSGAELSNVFSIKVDPANQSNQLFNGISFESDSSVRLIKKGATDEAGDGSKALNYVNGIVISDSSAFLGGPVGASTIMSINDFAAGDTVGGQVLTSPMITIGMNYGAILKNDGGNITDAGMTLWRNAIYKAAGFSIPTQGIMMDPRPSDFNILIYAAEEEEVALQKFLTKNNFNWSKLWVGDGALSSLDTPDDTIALLNEADIIIIGRSGNSGQFGNNDSLTRALWNNHVMVPIIENSAYHLRTSRLNWVNSGDVASVSADPIYAHVDVDDEIFTNVAVAGDSMIWAYASDDQLNVGGDFSDSIADAAILATYGNNLLAARWDTLGKAYYKGSADTVRSVRVMFGFGYDNTGFKNHFPLTDEGQQVYFNEMCRILEIPQTDVMPISNDATLSALTVGEGTLDPAFDAATTSYAVEILGDSVEITATASSSAATVSGAGYAQAGTASILVTAENGRPMTYSVAVSVIDGVEEIAVNDQVKMYPNPANSLITVEGLTENTTVRLLNTVGQLLQESTVTNSKVEFNLDNLDSGIYLIQFELDGKVSVEKFIKQ